MKKIYFILVSVMLLFSGATAKAQYGRGDTFINTLELIYSPVSFSVNGTSYYNMNAVGVDFNQSYTIVDDSSFYLLYGGVLQYTWGGKGFMENNMKFFTAAIPLSLGYDFAIPNTKFSVLPYAGLNVYDHIVGTSGNVDLFDSYQMGGKKFDDFGFGWQAGVKLVYGSVILSAGYQGPLTSLYSGDNMEINLSQVNIALGIRF